VTSALHAHVSRGTLDSYLDVDDSVVADCSENHNYLQRELTDALNRSTAIHCE